ncbi:multicopper oxidase domain-containing protein [Plantactinospora siamensis]|uniref:Multicopper oxidase domain-containing protein n=1 Tax=Plantactinospora siamensis TaxID=555372 RepID=A0ABV6P0B7_9ACTN
MRLLSVPRSMAARSVAGLGATILALGLAPAAPAAATAPPAGVLAAPPVAAAHGPAPAAVPPPVAAARPDPGRASLAAPAPPQGPLPQTGCTLGAGVASCDLWAKPGSVTLPGATSGVPIWGFTSTAAGTATLPGPVLVVDQGSSVTISVHNQLTAGDLSLALPAVTGLAPDRTGVAPGGTKTYTFTAGRPGTYLYEAGHTADGARQAAMGLVGALVVRAAAVGGRPSGYGDAASVYDDEAVLVLTEVDPALNANPGGFDMRAYSPKYRLINGKAFPETDVLATDINRRVLLRYVDAGLQPHPMTLLGLDQFVVGQDARPAAYPEGAVTLPLQPGQAVDAVVSVPAGPDGRRFALLESGGQLNNAGQRYGTIVPGVSPQQAFGGMLTFLDTNPPPVSGDHVGPVSRNIRVSPDPASVLDTVTVTADISDAANGNSIVDRAELVVDDLSIAEGTGIALGSPDFGAAAVVTGATGAIPGSVLTGLGQGRHTVYVRGHDVAGNWGVVGSATFNLAKTGAATTAVTLNPNPTAGLAEVALTASGDDSGLGGTVTGAEYFIDATGANGAGTALALDSPGAAVTAESGAIPAVVMAALPEGRHTVSVHTRDSFNLWGPYATADLIVDRTVPTLLSGAALPAATNGSTGSPADPTDLRINAAFTDPTGGAVHGTIAAAEGFLETAGADGTGLPFQALDGSYNSGTENTYGLIPLTELIPLADGPHQVLVHARDSAGNWGPLTAVVFTIDRAGPVVSAVTATPNPTNGAATLALSATATDALSAVTAAEWFDGTDPGVGHGTAMTVSGGALSATVNLSGLAAGAHTLRVRARDAVGNWGTPGSVTVTVQPPNAIFADGFAGNTAAWSQTVGTASAASGALVVGGVAYVVDNRPTAERTFHAKFDVTLGSFNPQTATVDLYQLRGATGAAVLTVQYRRNGGTNQFRLGQLRSTGWAYTGWVAASGGTVRVDWSSGTAGVATLKVGTVTVGSLTGNTSAYVIESAALGLVARSAATTGSLTFDNYASTRYTAP